MENITTPTSKPKGPCFTVVMLATGALISTTVAVALIHVMYLKYCKKRRQVIQAPSIEPPSFGLDERVLNTIPILFYSSKTCEFYGINQSDDECVICLSHLEKGDLIRWLPICNHVFHVTCIDDWFQCHSNCPICRSLLRVSNNCLGGAAGARDRNPLSRTRSGNLMCHCNKLVLPIEGLRPSDLIKAGLLKRSLSMDRSSVVVDTDPPSSPSSLSSNCNSSSSSSSPPPPPPLSKIDFVLSRLYQTQSTRHLERVSSMAPRWLHGLRSGQGGDLRNIPILPY